MARHPDKFARVIIAVADADGPVLIHCAGGRDRTGMVCSMLLPLTGVEPGHAWRSEELDEALAQRIPELLRWVEDTDVADYLLPAGVDERRLDRLRELLQP